MQFQEDYRKLLRIKYLLWGSTAFFLELHIDKESHMYVLKQQMQTVLNSYEDEVKVMSRK